MTLRDLLGSQRIYEASRGVLQAQFTGVSEGRKQGLREKANDDEHATLRERAKCTQRNARTSKRDFQIIKGRVE